MKILTGKSENEIDITIKVVRMGGGWNWHRANPVKYQKPLPVVGHNSLHASYLMLKKYGLLRALYFLVAVCFLMDKI